VRCAPTRGLLRGVVRHRRVAHEPVRDELAEGRDGLLQRRLGVVEVGVVQVDRPRRRGARGMPRPPPARSLRRGPCTADAG
jgi:hypothetical protein